MTTIVIMPGGFHPFHPGHLSLYNAAKRVFTDAEIFVAATADISTRPFPYDDKKKLATIAGVEPAHFVQVKSPFQALEITQHFDPKRDKLIFVRSEKEQNIPPIPGQVKKDGSPGYLQPLVGAKRLEPFAKHAYMAYLPVEPFGMVRGMVGATQIRQLWPGLGIKDKIDMVHSLYPATANNPALTKTVVKILDKHIVSEEDLSPIEEGDVVPFRRPAALTWQQVPKDVLLLANDWFWASEDDSGLDAVMDPKGIGSGTRNAMQYAAAKLQQKGWSIDHNDEYDDRFGPYHLRLTNRRGQTVLLPIEDAQDFTGWAAGTNTMSENQGWAATLEERAGTVLDLTKNFGAYDQVHARVVEELPGGKLLLKIIKADAKPGAKGNLAVGQQVKIHSNYLRRAPLVSEEQVAAPPASGAGMTASYQRRENQPVDEALSDKNLQQLEKAKAELTQQRQKDIADWEKDVRQNFFNKIRPQAQLQQPAPQSPPVVPDNEPLAAMQQRSAALKAALQKLQNLERLSTKLSQLGLMTPNLEYFATVYDDEVDAAPADAYKTLNQKLDKGLEVLGNRLAIHRAAFSKPKKPLEEKWSEKYKRSINCANPRGFSQRAHCQGRKK